MAKFYYRTWTWADQDHYRSVFGEIQMPIDGVERTFFGCAPWILTTQIEAGPFLDTIWQAVSCHQSQLPMYSELAKMGKDAQLGIWGQEGYYRAFSTVNGGREIETDLFAGLR